jgi:hypothetical protein
MALASRARTQQTMHWRNVYAMGNQTVVRAQRCASGIQEGISGPAKMGVSAQSKSYAKASPECAAAASTPTLCHPTGRVLGSFWRAALGRGHRVGQHAPSRRMNAMVPNSASSPIASPIRPLAGAARDDGRRRRDWRHAGCATRTMGHAERRDGRWRVVEGRTAAGARPC